MSVIVTFEGQRKVIKISSPNTLMQSILVEAAEHFKLNPTGCCLKHKKITIDTSQPYRFANLSNNAQVDLVYNGVSSSNSSKSCKIALSVENSSNIGGVFDSSLSLWNVIESFINEGKLPLNILDMNPEVVYLRSIFNSEESLKSTTLVTLGLSGQSARLQLRYLNKSVTGLFKATSFNSIPMTTPSSPSLSSTPMEVSNKVESIPMVVDSENSSKVSTQNSTEASPDSMIVEPSRSNTVSERIPPSITSSIVESIAIPAAVMPKFIPNIDNVKSCLATVLQNNFDATTLPAVITITKYVINILNNPENNEKFLTVNSNNKVFLEKVSNCKGAIELLASIGFQPRNNNTLVMESSSVDLTFLSNVYDSLQATLTELNVDEINRPQRISPTEVQKKVETTTAFVNNFDPFKSSVVRTLPQPDRVKSQVEEQLEQLNKRRLELEGNIEDVVRNTEVLFPNSKGEVANMPSMNSVEEDSSSPRDDSSSSGISKSLVTKILKKGENDTPLSTKAFKDLQKAQKARIYNKTLIRIRFPDRMCLQGYFHPRNTIEHVYEWIVSCLVSLPDNVDNSTERMLELYTTPPRVVLLPTKCNANVSNATLSDLQLVPAAVMYVAWNDTHPSVQFLRAAELMDTPYANTSVGRYLAEHLLLAADEKIALNSATIFPTSAPLDPATQQGGVSSSSEKLVDSKHTNSSSDSKPKSSGNKFKWFKL